MIVRNHRESLRDSRNIAALHDHEANTGPHFLLWYAVYFGCYNGFIVRIMSLLRFILSMDAHDWAG